MFRNSSAVPTRYVTTRVEHCSNILSRAAHDTRAATLRLRLRSHRSHSSTRDQHHLVVNSLDVCVCVCVFATVGERLGVTAPTPPPHAQRLAAPLVPCAGSVQALLTQTHVNCKAHPCFLLSIFRIKNFNPNMVRAPGYPRPPIRPFERPTFESGKPKCASGATPTQPSTRVQQPDGTWTSVATGAWTCGSQTVGGGFGIDIIRPHH